MLEPRAKRHSWSPTAPGAFYSLPVVEDMGRTRRAGRGDSPRLGLRDHPVVKAVGSTFAQCGITTLIGMSRGTRRDFGQCVFNGQPLRFDFWFPHLGIAVDVHAVEDSEHEAKDGWCRDRKVIYATLGVGSRSLNLDTLRQMAQERRLQANVAA